MLNNQAAVATAGVPLSILAVIALKAVGVEVTPEQVAVVAPLLQSMTHYIVHLFNKSRG
jgi:hypothetical protein